jgi:hypothetical protein
MQMTTLPGPAAVRAAPAAPSSRWRTTPKTARVPNADGPVRHTSVWLLAGCARVSGETLAEHQADGDPARRRHNANALSAGG